MQVLPLKLDTTHVYIKQGHMTLFELIELNLVDIMETN